MILLQSPESNKDPDSREPSLHAWKLFCLHHKHKTKRLCDKKSIGNPVSDTINCYLVQKTKSEGCMILIVEFMAHQSVAV